MRIWVVFLFSFTAWAAEPLPGHNAVRFYLPGEESASPASTQPARDAAKPLSVAVAIPAVISLNGDWDFFYDGIPEAKRRGVSYAQSEVAPELPSGSSYEATMPVPAYWDDHLPRLQATSWWFWAQFNANYRKIDFPMGNTYVPPFANLAYLVGTGYYRKTLWLPEGLSDKKCALSIGGVVAQADVYLNGSKVGEKRDYLTPAEIDLSGKLRVGSNELVIAVTNRDTFARGAPTSCAIDGYAGFTGGIYGSVSLRISGAPRIKDLYLHAVGDKLLWQADMHGFVPGSVLQWSVFDGEGGKEILSGEEPLSQEGRLAWQSTAATLERWTERNPKLYVVEARSVVGGEVRDRRRQTFGLRTLVVRGKNIFLNDKAIMLRGICDSWYYPKTTTAPRDPAAYMRMIRKYKELGFNWIRFHTSTPRQEYLEAADKLGMLIQVESPRESDEQTWMNIIRAARNHPSVILYCVSNEALMDEETIARVIQRQKVMKDLVPDALFSPMQALRGVEYGAGPADFGSDAVEAPFLHNPRRLAVLKPSADVFQPTGWSHFSFNSVAKADAREINAKLDLFERPCLLHEIGIHGTYLDLRLTERYRGTRIGTDLFDSVRRYLDQNGLLAKADIYYRNSCRWAQLARKHAVERARLCENVQGYDLLGAVDVHWLFCGYTCGIMNEFLELKPGESPQDVLNYNGESVLLTDLDVKRMFFAGDPFKAQLFASLYGDDACNQGTLYWNLKDDTGKILFSHVVAIESLPAGRLSSLGDVEFQLPSIERGARLRLSVRLLGAHYETENQWSIWVFPRKDFSKLRFAADDETRNRLKSLSTRSERDASTDSPRIISRLTREQIEFLKAGGRVVLLGTEPFGSAPGSFQVAAAGRVVGNQATVISEHPIFAGFPHEGFCDWQFYEMLNDSRIAVFDDPQIPFQPILEVASTYKLLKKQAALFELRVGKGSLLVCTLNLKDTDPAGRFLLYRLIEYASDEQFQPASCLKPEFLESLLK